MRVVLVDAPEEFLEERRRLGQDVRDEVWEGVLHVVPPPSSEHQGVGVSLLVFLHPLAVSCGLRPFYETGVFRPDASVTDYRVPDLVFAAPEQVSDRGVEGGAALVVEILSPNDESREKLPFYEAVGTQEVLLVDPATRCVELYVLRGGRLHAALPDDGAVRSAVLGVTFSTSAGPKLKVQGPSGEAEL